MSVTEKEGGKRTLAELHQYTHKKIKYISSKRNITEREVYQTAKEFFKELLKLDYEFTHEELIEELQKKYLDTQHFKKLKTFITSLGQMEYTKKEFTQKELQDLLTEMKEILNILIHHEVQKKGFLEKIFLKLHLKKQKHDEFTETTQLEKIEKEVVKEENEIKEIKAEEITNNLNSIYKTKQPQNKIIPTKETNTIVDSKKINMVWPLNTEKKNIQEKQSEKNPNTIKKQEETTNITTHTTPTTDKTDWTIAD